MFGQTDWKQITGTMTVKAAGSTRPLVLIRFGDDVKVWLRPAEAELLERQLREHLEALAAV